MCQHTRTLPSPYSQYRAKRADDFLLRRWALRAARKQLDFPLMFFELEGARVTTADSLFFIIAVNYVASLRDCELLLPSSFIRYDMR